MKCSPLAIWCGNRAVRLLGQDGADVGLGCPSMVSGEDGLSYFSAQLPHPGDGCAVMAVCRSRAWVLLAWYSTVGRTLLGVAVPRSGCSPVIAIRPPNTSSNEAQTGYPAEDYFSSPMGSHSKCSGRLNSISSDMATPPKWIVGVGISRSPGFGN